ncbi:TPA: replication initiation protein [Klebsiella pneumoniae]|nr:replication initiation protein [Klebsiella pneumoniae]
MGAAVQQLEIFSERLPKKPYYTDDLATGLRIVARETAKKARYIQPNGATHKYYLVFDVDRLGAAIDWADRKAPAPNITVMNRENGHAHLIYCLHISVRTAPDASLKPLKYAAAVERALRHALDADVNYSGLICKNPLNAHWQVAVWEENSYTLDWLADCLDMNASEARRVDYDYGLGRNCQLFEKTRQWSYRAIRQGFPDYPQWLEASIQRVEAYNLQLTTPLSSAECATIGKSVAKWTYQRFTEKGWLDWVAKTHTPEIQAIRGRKGGKVGGKIGGKVSKRKPVADSAKTLQPWLDLGISRATYYRRKK